MRVEIIDAPDGIDATWYTDDAGETLYVALSPDLDEVTRQRYITQAKREHGIEEERRRRIAVPFVFPAGRGRTAGQQAAIVAGSVAAAAVVATAAVMVPAALDDNGNQTHRRAPHAAAAPSRPGSPTVPSRPEPSRPDPAPTHPAPDRTTPAEAPVDLPHLPLRASHGHGGIKARVKVPGAPPARVDVPTPPLTSRKKKPIVSVAINPPAIGDLLCVRLDVGIRVRIGCRKR